MVLECESLVSFSFCSSSAEQTQLLGNALGRVVQSGVLVLLNGELGAGKTCLAKGIASGLGVAQSTPITSPTYTLLNSYVGRLPLYHFDLYRLADEDELLELGFDEYFHGDGVALVEWAQRCPQLVTGAMEINITYVDDNTRQFDITIDQNLPQYQATCELLRNADSFSISC